MLNDFTWNMTGYIPKHHVNPHGDSIIPYVAERIFQLEPEPPKVDSLNEYILSALQDAGKEFALFFVFPTSLRAATQQAYQILSRHGWRRSVRHRPIYRYKALLPGTDTPKADGL